MLILGAANQFLSNGFVNRHSAMWLQRFQSFDPYVVSMSARTTIAHHLMFTRSAKSRLTRPTWLVVSKSVNPTYGVPRDVGGRSEAPKLLTPRQENKRRTSVVPSNRVG